MEKSLNKLRQERNWSQPELAEAIGIEQSYLSKLENDKSVPSPDMLDRILEAFDIDLETLLEGMDETEIRNHLRSIPLVNGHLLAQKESAQRKRARWVIGSSLLCVLGITTMVLGIGTMGNPIVIYDYGSEEIVPNGDNGGTRTFELYNTRSEIRSEWQWINVSGAFLLALGIFGFVIERKLYPKSS